MKDAIKILLAIGEVVIPALIVGIVAGFMIWVIDSSISFAGPKIESPCTVYNNHPISQVPARCIQYFINQNEKN